MNHTSDFYFTITNKGSAEFKDRGSKFIALAYPIKNKDEFKLAMLEVKNLHPKASHYCYAYKIGIDNNNFRSSDAGEPNGSAGKPILNSIESKNITDVLIVVVRYFGGSLLGVPGLINAYKTTASLALQTTQIVQKPILNYFELEFDYTQKNVVMQILKKLDAIIIENNTLLFCKLKIAIPKSRLTEFEYNFSELHQVTHNKL
jgi:uncharacterized YigZ family protein